ncbi:hypothetical protein [Methylococcus capsulatus]|uniref:YnfA family protein n=1 Tax=Methylococcus sp. BF19-07 TaxID=2743472 RepID=UPI0032170857
MNATGLFITGLFIATALAGIIGCFLPYLGQRKSGPNWLLIPAAMSLALFVWLLALDSAASGRVYAAAALVWLRGLDGVTLSAMDWAGAGAPLLVMSITMLGWHDKA